jgi:hypothetical protein
MAAWNPDWRVLLVKEKMNQGAQATDFGAHRLKVIDLDYLIHGMNLL